MEEQNTDKSAAGKKVEDKPREKEAMSKKVRDKKKVGGSDKRELIISSGIGSSKKRTDSAAGGSPVEKETNRWSLLGRIALAQQHSGQPKINFPQLLQRSSTGGLPASYTAPAKVAKRGRQPLGDAGPGWFGMRPSPMTEELRKDLQLIRNRAALQPTKFYKSSDPTGPVVQTGTVIEGPSEYYSSRLTKKQRRGNLVDEILADADTSGYAKQKYKAFQQDRTRKQMDRRKRRKKKR